MGSEDKKQLCRIRQSISVLKNKEAKMARFRRKAKHSFRFGKRRSHRSGGKSVSPLKIIIPAAIYGAGRQYLVNLAAPLTAMIPLGAYADEAVLGIGGYFLAKKGKGMLKNVGVAMLTIEAASLGSQIMGGGGSSSNGGWR